MVITLGYPKEGERLRAKKRKTSEELITFLGESADGEANA